MSTLCDLVQNEQVAVDNLNIKKINNFLNSPKTRIKGLHLLNVYLSQCSDEDFVACCTNWMQSCCKVDNPPEHVDFAIETLDSLFKFSENYPELNKSVSFFITTRFFDYFFKHLQKSQVGWSCAETCFLIYKGPCGPSKETIEKHLSNEVARNQKVSKSIAQCFALLPSLGGGGNDGINYKKNWEMQVKKFVDISQSILRDLFADVDELQEYDKTEHTYEKTENEDSPEHLVIQLYNHCLVLNFMLLNKYPAPKCIPTDLVLQLVCRGLAINPKTLSTSQTLANMALQKVLPEVHDILHSLLSALITTCKNQMLPYCNLICKLIKQTLEWTHSESFNGTEKPLGSLRISVYETLCNWLVATKSGSCVDTISNTLISNILGDIQPKTKAIHLKESWRKNQSKVEEQTHRRTDSSANSALCYAALKSAQFLLKYVGVLLKAEEQKCLQENVLKLLTNIQNSSLPDVPIPYSVSKCRRELYALLLELVTQPCSKWPPPTHFALRLFSRGQNDGSAAVSEFCSTALNFLTIIIHPQYGNAVFATPPEKDDGQIMNTNYLTWRSAPMEVDDSGGEEEETLENEPTISNTRQSKNSSQNETSNKSDTDSSERISHPSDLSDTSLQEDITQSQEYPILEKSGSFVAVKEEENERDLVEIDMEPEEPRRKRRKSDQNEEVVIKNQKTPSPEKPSQVEINKDAEVSRVSAKAIRQLKSDEKTFAEKPCKELNVITTPRRSIKTHKEIKSDENNITEESRPEINKSQTPQRKIKTVEEPKPAQRNAIDATTVEVQKSTTPQREPKAVRELKSSEGNFSEESNSVKSASPDLSNDEEKQENKKRYFLRSKTSKGSSEEPEEVASKRTSSPDSVRNTPTKSLLKSTPVSVTRPRTRALSKIETFESESESVSSKKDGQDEDEDIINSFHDSLVE